MDYSLAYNEYKVNANWYLQFTEDDLQEALITVHEKYEIEKGLSLEGSQMLALVYKTANYKMLSRNTTYKKRLTKQNEDAEKIINRLGHLELYTEIDDEQTLEDREIQWEIQLAQLKHYVRTAFSPTDQTVFSLYLLNTMKMTEIAKHVGISYGTCRNIMVKVKKELDKFLEIDIDEIIPQFSVKQS